jgi:hypothetical protein
MVATVAQIITSHQKSRNSGMKAPICLPSPCLHLNAMPYSMVLSHSHRQHPQSIKCKMSPETALPESHTSAKDDHDRATLKRYLTLTHPQEAVGAA